MGGPWQKEDPLPVPGKWRAFASSDEVACGVLGAMKVEKAVLLAWLGLDDILTTHFV